MPEQTKAHIENCKDRNLKGFVQTSNQTMPGLKPIKLDFTRFLQAVLPTLGLTALLTISTLAQQNMNGSRKAVRLLATSTKHELSVKFTIHPMKLQMKENNK